MVAGLRQALGSLPLLVGAFVWLGGGEEALVLLWPYSDRKLCLWWCYGDLSKAKLVQPWQASYWELAYISIKLEVEPAIYIELYLGWEKRDYLHDSHGEQHVGSKFRDSFASYSKSQMSA